MGNFIASYPKLFLYITLAFTLVTCLIFAAFWAVCNKYFVPANKKMPVIM